MIVSYFPRSTIDKDLADIREILSNIAATTVQKEDGKELSDNNFTNQYIDAIVNQGLAIQQNATNIETNTQDISNIKESLGGEGGGGDTIWGSIDTIKNDIGPVNATGEGTSIRDNIANLTKQDQTINSSITSILNSITTINTKDSDQDSIISQLQTISENLSTNHGHAAENITESTTRRFVSDTDKENWNNKLSQCIYLGTTAPTDTKLLWINSSTSIASYYNGTAWIALGAVWK